MECEIGFKFQVKKVLYLQFYTDQNGMCLSQNQVRKRKVFSGNKQKIVSGRLLLNLL